MSKFQKKFIILLICLPFILSTYLFCWKVLDFSTVWRGVWMGVLTITLKNLFDLVVDWIIEKWW